MSPELHAFWQRLSSHAEKHPHRLALWGEKHSLDYAALMAEIALRRQQLRAADSKVVGLALDNGPQALVWDLAIMFEGLTCVMLPPFFSIRQQHHCLEQSRADTVITEPTPGHTLHDAGFERCGEFWFRCHGAQTTLPRGTAKLTFTSGTTGTPKGVCLSADSVLTVARELYQASLPNQPAHHLSLLPLAILLENIGCYAALYAGAIVSLPSQRLLGIQGASGVDAQRLLACLHERQAHSMILVPQLLLLLVNACERGLFNPATLLFVAVGGARVSLELLLRAQAAAIPVFEGYGLSECASVVALNRPSAHRPGSVGKPLPHVRIQLAEDGEVLIGGTPMLGYLGDSQPPTGWWPTGDLGAFDAEGYLYLKGRKKHQFVTSYGRNVNPEWVEAELALNGRITQSFVYGEAMPQNHALLWSAHPDISDEQLQADIDQANLSLPDYARVHHWTRLEQPFSVANGMATANGRPRRDAILTHYFHLFTPKTRTEDFAS